MADLFLSYARADQERAATIAGAVEAGGRSLWWDRRLASGGDYGMVIERELAAARCVVVAWSAAARDSLWVRAEANEALDQRKLVQLSLDQTRLPLPFTMLHFLDFSSWSGDRGQAPWPLLEHEIGSHIEPSAREPGRRPDPGGIALAAEAEPPLQGFGRIAALGWAALATAAIVALAVVMTARDLLSGAAFGTLGFIALAVSALLLAASAYLLLRVERASRR